jgi:hypothetical protein
MKANNGSTLNLEGKRSTSGAGPSWNRLTYRVMA